ncbi:MAG: response regulator transcription factor [Zoogloea sp.]|nr:response regulator transcription factor [Zoogloea sp.]
MTRRVLIVEDHALLREAMTMTLSQVAADVVCAEANSAQAALACLEADPDWDLVVLDLMLPDMNGFSLLGVIARRFPDVPALVVSALDDGESVQRAMKAGASGFVSKSSGSSVLIEAVRTVLGGGVHVPSLPAGSGVDSMQRKRRPAQGVAERFQLTPAQSRVLELVAQGKSNREIAELLNLSEGPVKVHVSNIFKALNVTSRAQALVVMNRAGMRV